VVWIHKLYTFHEIPQKLRKNLYLNVVNFENLFTSIACMAFLTRIGPQLSIPIRTNDYIFGLL